MTVYENISKMQISRHVEKYIHVQVCQVYASILDVVGPIGPHRRLKRVSESMFSAKVKNIIFFSCDVAHVIAITKRNMTLFKK